MQKKTDFEMEEEQTQVFKFSQSLKSQSLTESMIKGEKSPQENP